MAMQPKLEPTTENVLNFIRQFIALNGFSPTYREIGQACWMSASNVCNHLERLEAWEIIARTPGRARSIRLLDCERPSQLAHLWRLLADFAEHAPDLHSDDAARWFKAQEVYDRVLTMLERAPVALGA